MKTINISTLSFTTVFGLVSLSLLTTSCSIFEMKSEKEKLEPIKTYVIRPLNDTGIDQSKYSSFASDYYFKRENLNDYPGQDPQFGRDAAAQSGRISGDTGFDFSQEGNCVLDRVTGLMWEVKKDASSPDLQSNKWSFTWDDSEPNQDIQLLYHDFDKIEKQKTEFSEREVELKKHEDIVIASEVLFEYNQYDLTQSAIKVLDEAVEKFTHRGHLISDIIVIGHTDAKGSLEYNEKLSKSRANSVKEYLEQVDEIPDKDIETLGQGELEPVDTNQTEEGRARNRRVVIRLEFKDSVDALPLSNDNLDVIIEENKLIVKPKEIETKQVKHDEISQVGVKPSEFAVIAKCSDKNEKFECTTSEYIEQMNKKSLCGYDDWRLPSREELRSIVNYGQEITSIDQEYFPNTVSEAYWTSSRYINNRLSVWTVSFEHGGDNTHEKHRAISIRLVRDAKKN